VIPREAAAPLPDGRLEVANKGPREVSSERVRASPPLRVAERDGGTSDARATSDADDGRAMRAAVASKRTGKMVQSSSPEVPLEARQQPTRDWQDFGRRFRQIEENVEKVVQGKRREIRLALAALVAEGHILIEDVPGVGKTMLAKAIARSIDCSFRRIQFTPDLLPTDVTGVNVFNQERGDFEFRPGAIFANIVLGDEINRASPKTQSALLECMEERQVTIDTETYQLGSPFMVIATQNPIEHEGTYPLPEAQLDRFMMRLAIGYPSPETEAEILATHGVQSTLNDIGAVADAMSVREMINQARLVYVAPDVRRYIVDIVEATRRHPDVYLGASPRASIMLLRAARAVAATEERDYVIPDDVKALVIPVLAHRVIVTADAVMGGRTQYPVLQELVNEVAVPVGGTA
jgi:MoxR-like ATPase